MNPILHSVILFAADQNANGTDLQNGLLRDIIAAIVQVVPLILIPLLLKGILDEVPMLGKFAQNAMNRTHKAALGYANQEHGFFGRRRARYMNNQVDALGRKIQPGSGRRTLGNSYKSYTDARKGQIAEINEQGKEEQRARILDPNDQTLSTRIARSTHNDSDLRQQYAGGTTAAFDKHKKDQINDPTSELARLDDRQRAYSGGAARADAETEARWKEATTEAAVDANGNPIPEAQALNTRLKRAGLNREDLVRQTKETRSYGQAGALATNLQTDQYAQALKRGSEAGAAIEDASLLTIAAGSVDPAQGRVRAQSAATAASFKEFDTNVSNQEALLTQELTDIQKRGEQDALVRQADGSFKTERVSGSRAAQQYLTRQLASNDIYKVAAARNKLFSQGTSGITAWTNEWASLQDSGHFDTSQEMKDLRVEMDRNLAGSSSLSSQLKSKDKMALSAINAGENITAFSAGEKGRAVIVGLNDGELADASTSTILKAISNGGITAERAAAILSDDVIRNKFDQEKIQILQTLKDGGAEEIKLQRPDASGAMVTVQRPDKSGTLQDVLVTRGQEAVDAIWNTQTGKLRGTPTESDPFIETDDTLNISSVVVPGLKVPGAGSPPKAIQDYIDQSHGLSRLSRDKFESVQVAVSQASGPQDNEDLINLQSEVRAEAIRRNEEAAQINKTVKREVYTQINVPPQPSNPGTPPKEDNFSEPQQAPSAPAGNVSREVREGRSFVGQYFANGTSSARVAGQIIAKLAGEQRVSPAELYGRLQSADIKVDKNVQNLIRELEQNGPQPRSTVWDTRPGANSALGRVADQSKDQLEQILRQMLSKGNN